MSFWTLFDGGYSMVSKNTFGRKIAAWFGYWLATRNKNVKIHKSCLISPDAKINPRDGVIEIGEKSSVALGVLLQGNVRMGKNSSLQAYCNIVGYGTKQSPTGLISIGDNVRIASHVMMIAGNHVFSDITRPIAAQGVEHKPIVIEDDVWLAGRVNVMAGVTIGKGSVIGAGAVVTKDIPPYSVAVGSPAKVIKNRN